MSGTRTPRGRETRAVDRREASGYIAKAEEFARTARSSLLEGNWNSAGLAAIHAGISAADAAIVASAGVRSSSSDHGASVRLLTRQVPEATATQTRQLTGLLNMKNTIEYEQRLATEPEARSMVEQSERLTRWARSVVEVHLGT